MSGELLTTKEVEKLMQLNRVTIYRLIREENFPAVKLGGQWRFPQQQVQTWLDSHGIERQPQPTPAVTVDPNDPRQLLHSLEVTSLLSAFAASINLSVSVIDVEGDLVVDCPNARHPFCQYVREKNGDTCMMAQNSASHRVTDSQEAHLLRCESGLYYLRAPVRFGGRIIAFVLMGPITVSENQPHEALNALDGFASVNGIDAHMLRQHYQTVQQFSASQVQILVKLLSQVMSTMLEVVSSRLSAVKRLNDIAQLVTVP